MNDKVKKLDSQTDATTGAGNHGSSQGAAKNRARRKRKARKPRFEVALFATCLVDFFRPSVGFASLELLQRAGCKVVVPAAQTCCGQPAYNSGDYKATVPVAKRVIELLQPYPYVVVPSGSCAGMMVHHYPKLLEGEWHDKALTLAAKTYELTTFLYEVAKVRGAANRAPDLPSVAYHDSCAGLRELGIREQPRALLRELCDAQVKELEQRDVCCGFGGAFCAKMPAIAAKMSDDKLRDASNTGATVLTGGDLGCLLALAGRAHREGVDLEVRHIAELLAGKLAQPAIGAAN